VTNLVGRESAMAVQGRGEGPVRATCEVLASRPIGRYRQLTLVAPAIAAQTRPGQFVSIGVGAPEAVLRRPFSVAGVSQHGPWAGTVDIIFSVVGAGTEWLAGRSKHDPVDVVGPLGRSFPLPKQPVACLLVGGGYGAAPLLYLAKALQRQGMRVDLAFGAATQDRHFNVIEGKRLASSATFTTEDGSFGVQGRVTDVLADVIATAGTGVIYACGPMGMLAGVTEVARAHDLPCQVAVEESMACGVGVCMTCVVPYERRGELVNVRACVEGPVLDGKRVAWDACRSPRMGDPRGEGPR
jgi:dihydroorotate dehydrogenase electron transfer subunit